MCDTLYKKSGDNAVFLKNSDRAVNEPNLVLFYTPRKAQGNLQCTYMSIPDEGSCSVLLYKPSWIWGAEMGINEFNVVIGNEAVFTKSKNKKIQSLIGMDFVRLALERSSNAQAAVQVIIKLLELYGQGGNCGFDHSFYYDNSYLIADANESYIVETSGKEWVVKKLITQGNISNRLSITTDYESSSNIGDFKRKNIEPIYSFFSGSKTRQMQGQKHLNGIIDTSKSQSFAALRSHTVDDKMLFNKGSVKSVCMHAGVLGDHTTGSMAVFFNSGTSSIWLTGSSTPCLSVFKPVYFGQVSSPVFTDEKLSYEYWLKREKVNRAIYSGLIDANLHRTQIIKLENEFIINEAKLNKSSNEYKEFCIKASEAEQRLIDSYDEIINSTIQLNKYWTKKSSKLGFNVFEKDLCKRKK